MTVFLGIVDRKFSAKRVLLTAISARYLRVVAQDYHVSVCRRVELYGIPQFQGNIALFKPTAQSSTYVANNQPLISSSAVDGGKKHITATVYTPVQLQQLTHGGEWTWGEWSLWLKCTYSTEETAVALI